MAPLGQGQYTCRSPSTSPQPCDQPAPPRSPAPARASRRASAARAARLSRVVVCLLQDLMSTVRSASPCTTWAIVRPDASISLPQLRHDLCLGTLIGPGSGFGEQPHSKRRARPDACGGFTRIPATGSEPRPPSPKRVYGAFCRTGVSHGPALLRAFTPKPPSPSSLAAPRDDL